VGGDFYNVFPLTVQLPLSPAPSVAPLPVLADPSPRLLQSTAPCDTFGVVLGDVSGKGVQGAMYMTVATTLVEARAERDVAPEEVLAIANAHLYPKTHRLRMFVAVFYGVLEVATGRLEFASAGQVPPVLARGGEPPRYQPVRGLPLGALLRARYERHAVGLAPGDTLVLASDGFVEARNPRGQVLGYDGFLEVVARHVNADPGACVEGIFREVDRFSGASEEQDDRTLVVIRHHRDGPLIHE
jgi:serine phosphatase RsbU (regulator of sigma subunit)